MVVFEKPFNFIDQHYGLVTCSRKFASQCVKLKSNPVLCTNGKKSNKNYLSKNYKLNTHKNICDSLSYSIRIRNGPAENHTGSPWLGDSRATNNNMKARTTIFFLDPKQLSLIICNTDNSVSKVVYFY